MAEYTVRWEIEVEDDSPLLAARQAWEMQRDIDSTATVYDVCDEDGSITRVDLIDGEEVPMKPESVQVVNDEHPAGTAEVEARLNARIEELQDEFREATGDEPSDYDMGEEDWAFGLGDDGAAELVALLAPGDDSFEEIAQRQGWNDTSQLGILMDFIDNHADKAAFIRYAQARAVEENSPS